MPIGESEVVVTDLCIVINLYAIITFKKGDNFLSCLSELYCFNDGENYLDSNIYISRYVTSDAIPDTVNSNTVDTETLFHPEILPDGVISIPRSEIEP